MARVESVDKVDRATLAVDCTEADFRTFETALYQVLHRTTANEPLRMIQQVEGQRGFEAWHLIVRRYDQRNTSDRSSAYAALISNITERDRAKDVEQFDDILRTFTNEMTKFEKPIWQDEGGGEGTRSQEIDAREVAELQVQRNGNAAR